VLARPGPALFRLRWPGWRNHRPFAWRGRGLRPPPWQAVCRWRLQRRSKPPGRQVLPRPAPGSVVGLRLGHATIGRRLGSASVTRAAS
jgi:hypothetical protein